MLTRKQWNKHKEVIIWFMDQPGGTEVLSKSPGNNDKWFLIMGPAWRLDTLYIINDIYSEYRKAIATGKKVQYYRQLTATWEDLETTNPNVSFREVGYRIKPEEPKIRVGDWVERSKECLTIHRDEILNKVVKVKENVITVSTYNKGFVDYNPEHLRLWKPKKNELVWVYDDTKVPHLAHFLAYNENDGYIVSEKILGSSYWKYCEPFIGVPPSFID